MSVILALLPFIMLGAGLLIGYRWGQEDTVKSHVAETPEYDPRRKRSD